MLEGLDRVDWASLHHAYGAATDVPDQIRALTSPDAEQRRKALHELYGNVFHQGSRWQASPYAVPFLFELVAEPSVPDRHEIAYLLVSLALGYAEAFLPHGIDPAEEFADAQESDDERVDPAEEKRLLDMAWSEHSGEQRRLLRVLGARWPRDTYAAVARGVPTFLALLSDDDPPVRIAAAYAVAWFPEHAQASLRAVRRSLAAPVEPVERANLILSLGLLARAAGDASDADRLTPHLQESQPTLLAVASAIALVAMFDGAPPPPAADVLMATISNPEPARIAGRQLPWHDGDLVAYAGRALHGISLRRPERGEEMVDGLIAALQSAPPMESLAITGALLDLLHRHNPPGLPWPPQRLSPLQRRGLEAIARHGAWRVGGGEFANYSEVMRSYGLPGTHREFERLVHGGAGD